MSTRNKSQLISICPHSQLTLELIRLLPTDKIIKDVTQLVLARRTRMCNFLEYKGAFPLPLPLLYRSRPALTRACWLEQTPRSCTAVTLPFSSYAVSDSTTMSSSPSRLSTGALGLLQMASKGRHSRSGQLGADGPPRLQIRRGAGSVLWQRLRVGPVSSSGSPVTSPPSPR